jgi:probable phosphoglycerate mutase
MSPEQLELVLVRHGETEWSRSGRHTGRTDVPLTARGRSEAQALALRLTERSFARVLTSPASRALETCRLAGFAERAELRDDLAEWDYGEYEGLTTSEIHDQRPRWMLWRDGVPGGETVEAVGARADRVIADLDSVAGSVLVFAHGHFLRILSARWIGLDPTGGRLLALDPATISVLGHEHEWHVIRNWNELSGAGEPTRR